MIFSDIPTNSFPEFFTSTANILGIFSELIMAYYPVDFELIKV